MKRPSKTEIISVLIACLSIQVTGLVLCGIGLRNEGSGTVDKSFYQQMSTFGDDMIMGFFFTSLPALLYACVLPKLIMTSRKKYSSWLAPYIASAIATVVFIFPLFLVMFPELISDFTSTFMCFFLPAFVAGWFGTASILLYKNSIRYQIAPETETDCKPSKRVVKYVKPYWFVGLILWVSSLFLPLQYHIPRSGTEGYWITIGQAYSTYYMEILSVVFSKDFITTLPSSAIFLFMCTWAQVLHALLCLLIARGVVALSSFRWKIKKHNQHMDFTVKTPVD